MAVRGRAEHNNHYHLYLLSCLPITLYLS